MNRGGCQSLLRSAKEPALLFLLLLLSSFLSGCRVSRKATTEKPSQPLIERESQVLVQQLTDSAFYCNWMSAKIATTVESGEKSTSFTISLRMKKDSVIWMSISPLLGIEVARIIVSKDSLKMLDRINTEYTVQNYDYLNNIFEVSLNFEILQAIILGNYFPYLDARKLKSAYVDEQYYILSTLNRRKLKRSLEEKDPNKRIVQDLWMNPRTGRIEKIKIEDNKTGKILEIKYRDFQNYETRLYPLKTDIDIQAEKKIHIAAEYSKVVVNDTLEFPFNVPEKYRKKTINKTKEQKPDIPQPPSQD